MNEAEAKETLHEYLAPTEVFTIGDAVQDADYLHAASGGDELGLAGKWNPHGELVRDPLLDSATTHQRGDPTSQRTG